MVTPSSAAHRWHSRISPSREPGARTRTPSRSRSMSGLTGRKTLMDALATQQLSGDDRPLDLAGALVDSRGADLAVQVLQQVALLQRPCAMDLHRGVDDELRRLRGVQL